MMSETYCQMVQKEHLILYIHLYQLYALIHKMIYVLIIHTCVSVCSE